MTTARIETSRGVIEVVLYPDAAPKTVNSFVDLARKGFYSGLVWHRVVEDFVAQTGCPMGTGEAGPGYVIPDELNDHLHVTGSLSMANTGAPNSGGSQFFVCHRPIPSLDGKHTVFGRVTRGIDVLYKIRQGDGVESIEVG